MASLGVTAVLVLVGFGLAATGTDATTLAPAGLGLLGVVWAVLGVAVAHRRDGRVVGLLMALVAVNIAIATTRATGWSIIGREPVFLAGLGWLVAMLNEVGAWLFAALGLLLLYFPDGRLPSRRWRTLPPVLIGAALARHAVGVFGAAPFPRPLEAIANPFAAAPPLAEVVDLVGLIALALLLVGVLAAAASVAVRFRRSVSRERAQLKWLALAGVGVPAFVVVCLSEVVLLGEASWLSLGVGLATLVGLPLAVGIAMLQHDLYDVDRAVSAALASLLAAGLLAGLFVLVATAAGVTLGRESVLAGTLGTAVLAVMLTPLRRAAQRWVDRRLYPRRQSALDAIRSLERRTHSGEAQPEQLEAELRHALRDPDLRVAYLPPGALGLVDGSGVRADGNRTYPIVMGGTAIGAILSASKDVSAGLMGEVARASGTLAEVVRLRMELATTIRELEAGRRRLVEVEDGERRRLERDLHDGAQQRLVSLGMSLRLAQRHLGGTGLDVNGLIDEAVAELGTAVAELRQIAHGLRPSRLDDGLGPALSDLSQRSPIPVQLDVTKHELPDPVATTIYFVASEAMANAVKHADATTIEVRVAPCDRGVEVHVTDDGRGGAVIRHGSGLAGLQDRVGALGGTFAVETSSRGTLVHAVLPCAF